MDDDEAAVEAVRSGPDTTDARKVKMSILVKHAALVPINYAAVSHDGT